MGVWERVGVLSSGLTFLISTGLLLYFVLWQRLSRSRCSHSKIEYSGRELMIFSVFAVGELMFCVLLNIASITSLAEPDFDSHHFTPARLVTAFSFIELQAALS